MPINIEGGLLVDGKEIGAGGLTSYTASVSFTSDTDGLITYDVVPSDDEFLLSMTVNSNTAANTDLAGSILNVIMHKSEITMTIEGETQTMLGYAGVLVVGDLSNKFDIFVTLPVGTATSGVIQMKSSAKKLYYVEYEYHNRSYTSFRFGIYSTNPDNPLFNSFPTGKSIYVVHPSSGTINYVNGTFYSIYGMTVTVNAARTSVTVSIKGFSNDIVTVLRDLEGNTTKIASQSLVSSSTSFAKTELAPQANDISYSYTVYEV